MPEPAVHTTSNPFATFAPAPLGVTFESQEEGEQIILLLRQHLITLVPPIILIVFLIVLPFIVFPLLSFIGISFSFLTPTQLFLATIFWYLLIFTYSVYRFIFWYFNVYILSNERIIDFDFHGILSKQASFAKLTQIEDLSPKMIGFFSTFFNYGNLHIQTAGEMPEFEFDRVPRPDEVAERISLEIRKEEQESPGEIA